MTCMERRILTCQHRQEGMQAGTLLQDTIATNGCVPSNVDLDFGFILFIILTGNGNSLRSNPRAAIIAVIHLSGLSVGNAIPAPIPALVLECMICRYS